MSRKRRRSRSGRGVETLHDGVILPINNNTLLTNDWFCLRYDVGEEGRSRYKIKEGPQVVYVDLS